MSILTRNLDVAPNLTKQDNALSAYSKVTQALPSASDKDIDTYRAWMKENAPVAVAETRFLEHNKDLISLTTRSTSNAPSAFSAIIIASAAILLPLLAFSMIAEFSGRLLVVAMVGGAASAIASNSAAGAERFVASHDGWRIATLYVPIRVCLFLTRILTLSICRYFGFMTIAAMFIP